MSGVCVKLSTMGYIYKKYLLSDIFMIAHLLRNITKHTSSPLNLIEDKKGMGNFGQLKIATITDPMTTLSLAQECRIKILSPHNYKDIIQSWKPDCIFVESAFSGVQGEWQYLLAKQPKYIKQISDNTIKHLLQLAKDKKIPTVFWNKDDGPYFDAFIDIAILFDYVFTADEVFLPRYKTKLPNTCHVDVLAMAYQPRFHNFTGFTIKSFEACFLGSFYKRILPHRQNIFRLIFDACAQSHMPLNIYDRHKKHLFHSSHFSFPEHTCMTVHDPVPYTQTQDIYKKYIVSFNINSVTNSQTMISRRLLEILACGGIMITNSSPAVENNFSNYCYIIQNQEQVQELLSRLRHGPSKEDTERAKAGALYVLHNHTWQCRLEQLAHTIGF